MIIIKKAERLLTLTDKNGCPIFTCPVSLGFSPVGRKEREGDGKTPEGDYYICSVNRKSKYHISLGISYPSPSDAKGRVNRLMYLLIRISCALKLRPPWHTPLGGFVMIHGEHPDMKNGDWTAGCIAVSNGDIEYLAAHCQKRELVRIIK